MRNEDYRYTATDGDGFCDRSTKPANNFVMKLGGYETLASTGEAHKAALGITPFAICVYVNHKFQLYDSGVFLKTSCPPDPLTNHVIVVVGSGVDVNGTPYWLCANSWASDWGEGGYIKLEAVGGAENALVPGTCGMYTESFRPHIMTKIPVPDVP